MADNVTYTNLLNTKTNQLEQVDNSQVQSSLLAGTHKVVPDEPILLRTPDGNSSEWHSSNDLNNLLDSGYHIPSEGQVTSDRAYFQKKEYIKNSPIETLKAGLEAGARGLSLGLSTPIEKVFGIKPEDIKLRQEANPILAPVAEVGGALLPLLFSGGTTAAVKGTIEAGRLANVAKDTATIGKTVIAATDTLKEANTAGKILNFSRALAENTPVSLLSKGAGAVTEALGGKIGARIAGQIVMGAGFGGSNYFTEAALGNPDEAAQHLLGNMGMGAVFGGALQALGEGAGKAFSLMGTGASKAEDLVRQGLNKSWKTQSEVITNSLKQANDVLSVDFAHDLEVAIKSATPDTVEILKKELIDKYPSATNIIKSDINASTTLEHVPNLQQKFIEDAKSKIDTVMQALNDPSPETWKPFLKPLVDNVKQITDTQNVITKNYESKLTSYYDQLVNSTTQERKELISKLTSEQLQSAKIDLDKQITTLTKLGESTTDLSKLSNNVNDEISKISITPRTKIVSGLDDTLNNAIKNPEIITSLDNNITDIANRIQRIKVDIRTGELKVSSKMKDEINRLDSIFNIGDATGAPKLGLHQDIQNGKLKSVFQKLKETKKAMNDFKNEVVVGGGKAGWSQTDIDMTNNFNQWITGLDTTLKDSNIFGKASADYTLFNKNYSAFSNVEDWVGSIFKKLPAKPADTTDCIQIGKTWYEPDFNKIKAGVTGKNITQVDALNAIPKYYKDSLIAYSEHPDKELLPLLNKPNEENLIKNINDLSVLSRLSETGSIMRDTDFFRMGSKYGILGSLLFWAHVPLATISALAGVAQGVKLALRNPNIYINNIERIATTFHATDRMIQKALSSKILGVTEAAIAGKVAKVKEEKYKSPNFKTVQEQLKTLSDSQKRYDAINKINDLSPDVTPKLSQASVMQINKSLDYLIAKLPKETNLPSLLDQNRDGIISDSEKRKFMEVYKYADDPYNLVKDFPNISVEAVNTVKAIYPVVYTQIMKHITDMTPKLQGKILPAVTRRGLSALMGTSVDGAESSSLFKTIQGNFKAIAEQQQQPPQKGSPKALKDMPSRYSVSSQREME